MGSAGWLQLTQCHGPKLQKAHRNSTQTQHVLLLLTLLCSLGSPRHSSGSASPHKCCAFPTETAAISVLSFVSPCDLHKAGRLRVKGSAGEGGSELHRSQEER